MHFMDRCTSSNFVWFSYCAFPSMSSFFLKSSAANMFLEAFAILASSVSNLGRWCPRIEMHVLKCSINFAGSPSPVQIIACEGTHLPESESSWIGKLIKIKSCRFFLPQSQCWLENSVKNRKGSLGSACCWACIRVRCGVRNTGNLRKLIHFSRQGGGTVFDCKEVEMGSPLVFWPRLKSACFLELSSLTKTVDGLLMIQNLQQKSPIQIQLDFVRHPLFLFNGDVERVNLQVNMVDLLCFSQYLSKHAQIVP